MKNYKGFTTVEVLLVLLILAIISGAGVIAYSNMQKENEGTEVTSKTSQPAKKRADKPTEAAKSDEELIREALTCDEAGKTCEIKDKTDTLAWATAGDDHGGANYYLAKKDKAWTIIHSGNGDIPQATVDKYQIPESWLGPQMDEVQ